MTHNVFQSFRDDYTYFILLVTIIKTNVDKKKRKKKLVAKISAYGYHNNKIIMTKLFIVSDYIL